MDRMHHEVARIRHAEIEAQTARRPRWSDLRDYRTDAGIMRIIRLGRR